VAPSTQAREALPGSKLEATLERITCEPRRCRHQSRGGL
jgi:hypothetical protein